MLPRTSEIAFKMPNKCCIVNCHGNYNKKNSCRVFRQPNDNYERQKWINKLPEYKNYKINLKNFFICERHWDVDADLTSVKLPGGSTRPGVPSTIFNVPMSCLPTTKPLPRPPKIEDRQLEYFLKKDTINSFTDFQQEEKLKKLYNNVVFPRTEAKFVCLFILNVSQNAIFL